MEGSNNMDSNETELNCIWNEEISHSVKYKVQKRKNPGTK